MISGLTGTFLRAPLDQDRSRLEEGCVREYDEWPVRKKAVVSTNSSSQIRLFLMFRRGCCGEVDLDQAFPQTSF